MRQAVFSVALGLTVVALSGVAHARPFRVDEIPNGNAFGCRNCHNDDNGSTNTPFLADVRSSLAGPGQIQEDHVTWGPALCNADSDGDGWSNAIELGDPDCVWTPGAAPSGKSAKNPGNPKSHPPPVCKNGILDAGEACDAGQQAKTDCMDESAGQGELGCDESKCIYDYTDCSLPPGGNAIEDGGLSDDDGCTASGDAGGAGGALAFLAVLSLIAFVRRR